MEHAPSNDQLYPPYVGGTTNSGRCFFRLNEPLHIGCQDERTTFATGHGSAWTHQNMFAYMVNG